MTRPKRKTDPYGDAKFYHRAHLMDDRGNVSALCFKFPRAISGRRASWTIRDEAVTCPKCLTVLALIRVVRGGGEETK
jgi:hypothetical protein